MMQALHNFNLASYDPYRYPTLGRLDKRKRVL